MELKRCQLKAKGHTPDVVCLLCPTTHTPALPNLQSVLCTSAHYCSPVFSFPCKHSLFEVLECDVRAREPLREWGLEVVQRVHDECVPSGSVGGRARGLVGVDLTVLLCQWRGGVAVLQIVTVVRSLGRAHDATRRRAAARGKRKFKIKPVF